MKHTLSFHQNSGILIYKKRASYYIYEANCNIRLHPQDSQYAGQEAFEGWRLRGFLE